MKILKTLALALVANLIIIWIAQADPERSCRPPFVPKLVKICLWSRPMDILELKQKLKNHEPLPEENNCRLSTSCELKNDPSINYNLDLSDDDRSAYTEALKRAAEKGYKPS